MILLVDNYDSFVFNLSRYFSLLGESCVVFRNDVLSLEEIEKMRPRAIVLSPGPCTPDEAGICLSLIREFRGQIPIFGVCLGHQAIAQAYGALVRRSNHPRHGKVSFVERKETALFESLPEKFEAASYYSLTVDSESIPHDLTVLAYNDVGDVMAIGNDREAVYGVQFHPESILTPDGLKIIKNFLNIVDKKSLSL